jgi:peptidoglycan hydrolase-like protein with peptidoglycan-binding domain
VQVQRRLGLLSTGSYDQATSDAVRSFQLANGLMATGVVDEATWLALEALVRAGLRPTWADSPEAVSEARRRLAARPDEDLGNAVRRFQSARGLPLTGLLDDDTVRAIGD